MLEEALATTQASGAPPESMLANERSSTHDATELDDWTLALLYPSTQSPLASPPQKRARLQPTSSKLTPGGSNLLHRLEEATPRGTHEASAEYKAAAATPEGETAGERERRLAC